jgi:hypothetical protein
MKTLLALMIVANTACLRSTEFRCASNDQCGASGTCEMSVGFCSFPDSQCGQRFGDSAGPLANQCVTAATQDAGGDAPGVHDGPRSDASPIDAPNDCPAGYNALPGITGHLYKLIATSTNWNAQVTSCAHVAPLAYLAIPDDATELTALDTLTSTTYWVGVSGTGPYTTVKNAPQTFLPWGPNQPNPGGNASCVDVTPTGSDAGTFALSKCGPGGRPAICECEP